jgi:hypothetical protein
MEAKGERRYSSYSFTNSALGEVSGQRPDHALTPGKGSPVPITQESALALEPVRTQMLEKKSSYLSRGLNLDRP